VASDKPEHNPILVVHTNTVKASEIAFKLLQPVGGRDPEILNGCAGIQQIEFFLYARPNLSWQLAGRFGIATVIDVGRGRIRETDDHFLIIP
jgi:hypothetical protein